MKLFDNDIKITVMNMFHVLKKVKDNMNIVKREMENIF